MNEVTKPATDFIIILNEHPIESVAGLTVLFVATYGHEISDRLVRFKDRVLLSRGLDIPNGDLPDIQSHIR